MAKPTKPPPALQRLCSQEIDQPPQEPGESERKAQLNRRWMELVGDSKRVDLGTSWLKFIDRKRFTITIEQPDFELRYGPAERPGYELLDRRTVHAILEPAPPVQRGAPRKSPLCLVQEKRSFEPVPIETVLWDGPGSSSSADAQAVTAPITQGPAQKPKPKAPAMPRPKPGKPTRGKPKPRPKKKR
jgi:hypothetical protein